jgi:methionyl-tRNA formyltransferase
VLGDNIMRIALVTQEEPFYLPLALETFCGTRGDDVVALIILPAFNERLIDTAKRLFDFYGSLDFSRLLSRFVLARMTDGLNRIRPLTRPFSARDVACRNGIAVYKLTKINASSFVVDLCETIRPDLIVSIAASQILGKRVLDIPPLGSINLHSAPLPKYQGMMPNFWTMVHGEPQATVTVHYMVENLDAGDIIVQQPVPIYPTDSLHDLMVRSKKTGVQALLQAVADIEQGTVEPRPMDTSQATYFSFPKRADAHRLRQMGHSLL